MSVKAFVGFDFGAHSSSTNWANAFGGANLVATEWVSSGAVSWSIPPYLFHNNGVATLSQLIQPTGIPTSASKFCFVDLTTSGLSYGCGGFSGTAPSNYGAGTTTTRATWATAKGHQLAIVRSLVVPSLTAAEYWLSCDIRFPNLGTSSLAGYLSAVDFGSIFKWGDVALKAKSTTYISGTTHDIVFSVINNVVEVATITVPNVVCGGTYTSNTNLYLNIHVKLHGSTGLIEMAISGNAQSAAYTGQNTVTTVAEASATEIYIGPPVLDNGTNAYVGHIDNILVDDAAFPNGRPMVRLVTLSADNTMTDAIASGTSVTTVFNALSSQIDAKQLMFTSAAGKALFDLAVPSLAGLNTNVLGFVFSILRAANRYNLASRKIQVGVSSAGTESPDGYISTVILPFSSILTPPETAGLDLYGCVFEKAAGGQYTTAEAAAMDAYIKVV